MTHAEEPQHVIDDGETDVLTENEVVHVPAAAAELAEAVQHRGDDTFVADIPDWDRADPVS